MSDAGSVPEKKLFAACLKTEKTESAEPVLSGTGQNGASQDSEVGERSQVSWKGPAQLVMVNDAANADRVSQHRRYRKAKGARTHMFTMFALHGKSFQPAETVPSRDWPPKSTEHRPVAQLGALPNVSHVCVVPPI